MSSAFRRNFLILWSDLLIALSAFWLARYFGDMPRWYWLKQYTHPKEQLS